jgi:hypothetical protein
MKATSLFDRLKSRRRSGIVSIQRLGDRDTRDPTPPIPFCAAELGIGAFLARTPGARHTCARAEEQMKYGIAWLLGVPTSIIVLWFLANQMGCGF